jgi:hypothetical protein
MVRTCTPLLAAFSSTMVMEPLPAEFTALDWTTPVCPPEVLLKVGTVEKLSTSP